MLKIFAVMVVTATFAGLLIYNPYEVSSNSPAVLVNAPLRFAKGMPASAEAETVAAEEASTTFKPQDIEGIVLKVLANRMIPQERNCSGAVASALPDTSVAIVERRPLSESDGFPQRPVLQCEAGSPITQPVGTHEDKLASRMNGALPDRATPGVVRPVLGKRKEVSRVDGYLRFVRRARVGKAENPVVQPPSARHENTSVFGTYGGQPDEPITTAAQWPLLASNGVQQQPLEQAAAQMPVVPRVLGKRRGVSRLDGHLRLGRTREGK
jgi:hypothetical protein